MPKRRYLSDVAPQDNTRVYNNYTNSIPIKRTGFIPVYNGPIEKPLQPVYPEFDILLGLGSLVKDVIRGGIRKASNYVLEHTPIGRSAGSLPKNYAYRRTMQQEADDILNSGTFRKMPDNVIVKGSDKVYVTKSGRRFSFGKQGGNTHGGKAFSKGEPWSGTTSGTSDNIVVSIPGENTAWQVGHHGNYSPLTNWNDIPFGSGLWLPFGENGVVDGITTSGLRIYRINNLGRYVRQYKNGGQISMPKRRYLSNAGKSDKDYEDWATDLANVWGVSPSHILTSKEYDYPTYFAENREDAAAHLTGSGHFPDTYKTAEHPTFSDESRYSGSRNKFNPKGITGDHWSNTPNSVGNRTGQEWQYQFSPSQLLHLWNIPRTLNHLANTEDDGVYVTMPGGSPLMLGNTIYGGVLPNVDVYPRRTMAKGGIARTDASLGTNLITLPVFNQDNRLYQLAQYAYNYLKGKFFPFSGSAVIDLNNKNVARIQQDDQNIESILANEFVESNKNTYRRKKDFINTTDTLLGDKRIPLSKIRTFYGIENGKLKAGPIDSFNDTTTIVPNRAKYTPKFKKTST